MKIRSKILIPMIAIALLTAIAILGTVTVIFSGYVDETTEAEIGIASAAMLSEYERRMQSATDSSTLIAADPDIQQALADGDRDTVLARAASLDKLMEIDFITITDTEGNVVARSHEPDNYGDSVAKQENVKQALAGNPYATLETGSAVKLSVRAGTPVYSGGKLVGVVSSGYRLDTETFVDEIKALTGIEATVFLGDERLSTTVVDAGGNRLVGTKAAENVSKQVLAGQAYSGKAQVVGREAFVQYMPIADTAGNVLGMLFVGQYTDIKWSAVGDFILQGGLVALVLTAIAVGVALVISRRITDPLKTMVAAGNRLADGETDVEVSVATKDETRELADSFQRIIQGSREQERVITAIASGNLAVDIAPRSDRDAVAKALREMLRMNNQVFRQINNSAGQLADSSRQIANGSQNLAQGSTEQAGVVEELSASIATVAAKSRENADLATQAATLSDSIRANAEKGSGQMEELTAAVNAISDASNAIASVIKVIDDIAFQTNILALNAAVEAARAGEHGKGFAVVADEVRNLAGKSAEAAKDTGAMITDSIEKAKLGAGIAVDTAASLSEIVDGINENSRMVGEIAASASGASDAIDQINVGIDQVAQVIQQNSATAQESAAAAQELSAQSDLLNQSVAQFNLRDEGKPALSALPVHEEQLRLA